MIKIRFCLFETNSSTCHTVSWIKDVEESNMLDSLETNFTHIIDISECHYKTNIVTFKEKISFLYSYLSVDDIEYIEEHFKNKCDTSGYYYIDDFYLNNVINNENVNFRDFYKKNIKKHLLKFIKELSGKDAIIKNEDKFDYYRKDSCGWIPVDSDKLLLKELLVNKNLCIIVDEDYKIDEKYAIFNPAVVRSLAKIRKKMDKEESKWFDWFKIESNDTENDDKI